MASPLFHYCQACGRRIEKAEIRAGEAIQYRENWYCSACKDAASEDGPLDPASVAINPGLQTRDDEREITLSDLFAPVAATPPRRSTTARKPPQRPQPERPQPASSRRAGVAKPPVDRESPSASPSARRARPATPGAPAAPAASTRKATGVATGRARPTPEPPTPSDLELGVGRRARSAETPASPAPGESSGLPSWMPLAMGGTILALLAVIVFLLARQGPTPPGGGGRPAEAPGSSPAAPRPPDARLVRAVEELERAPSGAGRWRTRQEAWAALLTRVAGTTLEPRVRDSLDRLEQDIDRQARLQLEALKASAEPFINAGRTEEAVVRLESFDEELRTPRWQGILDSEIARIRALGR